MTDIKPNPKLSAGPSAAEWRSGALFDQVASLVTLARAWDRVKANAGASGGDGVTIGQFGAHAHHRLKRLAHELRNGRYAPGPARRVYIPKASGGLRPLDIPCVVDRVVQAAAALILDPVLDAEMEPSSFAYRRGRSVAQAVARVASLRREGFRHVVDGDIRAYFERIPHEALVLRLEKSFDDPALIDLICLWLEMYAPSGRGVPQGSPISPLLSNIYLDAVDEEIEGRGIRLVRFADDFVLLCKSENLAEGALERMGVLLGRHGLELNPEKTRIVDFDQGFRFLGHVFVRSLVFKEVGEDETPPEDAIAAAEVMTAKAAREARQARDAAAELDADATGDGSRRHAPRLRPLYLIRPGARLVARGEGLGVVEADGGEVIILPPARLGRIEIGPDADATLAALDLALANGIEVVRLNGHGAAVGRYETSAEDRAGRHLAQAAHALDPERRLTLARILVDGRVRNQRAFLRRLNRTRKDAETAAACVRLGRILRRLPGACEVSECMGYEGEAAALYWPALGRALPEGFTFSKRRRRPAPDPVNAVLSFLSGLLARDVRAMAQRAGLHVGIGILHTTEDGEDAAIYDLTEEFRAPVAEAATLALMGRKALTPAMFHEMAEGVRLAREAWPVLIRGYEAWVQRPIVSPRSGKRVLWRGLMQEQAHAFAAHCEGGDAYRPYVMDH